MAHSAKILDAAQGYWQIVRRYNHNRQNPEIRSAAIRDMRKLETTNAAVLRRVALFTAKTGSPPPTGPKFA